MANYVLVHGSFQGAWIWQPTAKILREAGHNVYVPTLDGCGERHHQVRPGITIAAQAREVADLMFYEDIDDVMLAGTSTGGLVVAKIAELARDQIKHIFFVDALAPQPGQKVVDIVQREPGSTPMPSNGLTRGPTREEMETRLFADLEPTLRTWAIDRVTPHPVEASDAPGELDAFWAQEWPATVIRCRLSVNPPESHQRATADKLKAAWYELDAGHYPMLSHPAELSKLLIA